MLEIGLPVILAAVSGLGAITTRLHNRIHELDRRLDTTELRIAENYLSKAEFSALGTGGTTHDSYRDKARFVKNMITLIKPILLKFAGSTAVKKLIVDLLAALAKRTDNDVDDSFVRHLAVMLKV